MIAGSYSSVHVSVYKNSHSVNFVTAGLPGNQVPGNQVRPHIRGLLQYIALAERFNPLK